MGRVDGRAFPLAELTGHVEPGPKTHHVAILANNNSDDQFVL